MHEPLNEACAASFVVKMKDEDIVELPVDAAVGTMIGSASLRDGDVAFYRDRFITRVPGANGVGLS